MANITKRRADLKIDDDAFGSLCDECGIKGLAKKSLQRSDGSHSLLLLAFSDLIEAAGGDHKQFGMRLSQSDKLTI